MHEINEEELGKASCESSLSS